MAAPGMGTSFRAASGCRILNVGGRMLHAKKEAIDLVVAECRAVLIGFKLGGEREVRRLHVHRRQQLVHRRARARSGVTNVQPLAFEVSETLDVRLLACDQREGLGMHRENRTQIRESFLESACAFVALSMHIRLRHAEVKLTRFDRVDVVGRAAG